MTPQAPITGDEVADVLERAADTLEVDGAWTTKATARLSNGGTTDAHDPNAVCFCALGAIFKHGGHELSVDNIFGRFLGGSGWSAVGPWNDDPERTQAEVVATLRSAARAARQQGGRVMPITRTITLDDPTPAELAGAFCDLDSEDQAAFLSAVWRTAKEWPGAGWCQQSHGIIEASDSDAREAIRVLASHLPAEDFAYIAAAQEQFHEA